MIYGGPDVQEVRNAWAGVSWSQAMAQKGFVIWQLDNRGTKGRGHAFESVIWHHLGRGRNWADQKKVSRYLVSLGFVDAERILRYVWLELRWLHDALYRDTCARCL